MSSLLDELHRREASTRAQAEELRHEIERLNERLLRTEEHLSRLEIARETVTEILGDITETTLIESGADGKPADQGIEPSRFGHGSPIGVLTVPPWRPDLTTSVLPPAYRDIVEVLTDAGQPLRAGHVAAAAGLSTDKSKVEGLRSQLKRLVERGWAFEDGPGRFTVTRPGSPPES